MNTIPISKLILFLGIYLVASLVTAFSLKSAEGTSDFENFADSALQPQQISASELEPNSGNTFESAAPAVQAASSGLDTPEYLLKALALQSHIWESDWAQYVRLFLWLIAIAMGFYIAVEGVRLIQGFIPFT